MNNDESPIHKLIQVEGLEYALIDSRWRISECSPGLAGYLADAPTGLLLGREFTELFPELIGYRQVLEGLRSGQQEQLLLERIHRRNLRDQQGYVTLRAIPYRDGWMVIASDATAAGNLEQRITQQRNELSLLATRLEKTRARLDDLLRQIAPEQMQAALPGYLEPAISASSRREITVIAADLRGFSAWAAEREPEIVLAVLNSVFDIAGDILREYEATLDQFTGDGLLAFFNAPHDQPDHARRALACARRLRDLPGSKAWLQFGIGIDTGVAIVGPVGIPPGMRYTALGETVNLARHLEQIAGPGQVLSGPAFARQIGDQCQPYGQLDMKGPLGRISIYHLDS